MFDLNTDPFEHFQRLLKAAHDRKEPEPNAMAVATVAANSKPSIRILYYKGMIRGGLSFYTNYDSEKAKDIQAHPRICANFYYPTVWQQIRITGIASKLTRDESEAYFRTRHRLSQIGAWASKQSSELPNLDHFTQRVEEFTKSFEGQEVPCPPHWGGFHLVPEEFEFWFGRDGRLHERYVYEKLKNGLWNTSLKYP